MLKHLKHISNPGIDTSLAATAGLCTTTSDNEAVGEYKVVGLNGRPLHKVVVLNE